MKKTIAAAALCVTALMPLCVVAGENWDDERDSDESLTVAVFGDWPYNTILLNSAHLLLDSVNADSKVRLVIHVGDIHSGSMPCTGAGLDPIPAGANPEWNKGIFDLFEQFHAPLVYTPGDNEWTDCHKTKELSSGAPLNELASVRDLFFPQPGRTLGWEKMRVQTQGERFSRTYPSDAQFVENVIWQRARVVFVTVNMPGSNNDGLKWTAPFTDEPARTREAAQRTGAAIRWLQAAFARANETGAKAVVLALQADMWDPAALASGGDGLNNYTLFVHELANLSVRFGRPVLLLNGDSHLFGSDHPLADPNSATGQIHATPPVPNLTRVTVQGSTNAPAEWLRLTINPRTPEVFTWENVPYCNNPLVGCP